MCTFGREADTWMSTPDDHTSFSLIILKIDRERGFFFLNSMSQLHYNITKSQRMAWRWGRWWWWWGSHGPWALQWEKASVWYVGLCCAPVLLLPPCESWYTAALGELHHIHLTDAVYITFRPCFLTVCWKCCTIRRGFSSLTANVNVLGADCNQWISKCKDSQTAI